MASIVAFGDNVPIRSRQGQHADGVDSRRVNLLDVILIALFAAATPADRCPTRIGGEFFVRVIRVIADLQVSDLAADQAFYTDVLDLEHEDLGLDWVARLIVPSTGEQLQLVSQDATGAENPVLTVKVDDVDEAYAIVQQLGHDIVLPLTTEPWGVRRFFVRTPGGSVLNIAQHHDRTE